MSKQLHSYPDILIPNEKSWDSRCLFLLRLDLLSFLKFYQSIKKIADCYGDISPSLQSSLKSLSACGLVWCSPTSNTLEAPGALGRGSGSRGGGGRPTPPCTANTESSSSLRSTTPSLYTVPQLRHVGLPRSVSVNDQAAGSLLRAEGSAGGSGHPISGRWLAPPLCPFAPVRVPAAHWPGPSPAGGSFWFYSSLLRNYRASWLL